MRTFIIIIASLFLSAGCNQREPTHSDSDQKSKQEHHVYIDSNGKLQKLLGDTPQHLRTRRQKLFVRSLNDVLLNGLVAENNRMVLKLSKKECFARGMTLKTYNELQANLKSNNAFFKSSGTPYVSAMVNDLHQAIKADSANERLH